LLPLFAGREAARLMLPRGKGNIFFTGATASLRGGSAMRPSREVFICWPATARRASWVPKNIHVAHPIIDLASTLNGTPAADRGAGAGALDNPDLLMPPARSESYWLLYQQSRTA
jgi:hypothetical protein